jgi:methylenetetrahydrofolate dehydrogenase (NADP+)/methenyltetrahydrofolate cyclohydrolase
MSAKIIDGKAISAALKEKIGRDVKARIAAGKSRPGLAVVLVGSNPASKVYVSSKCRACEEFGFYSKKIDLPEETTEEMLLSIIDDLNQDSKIHGILVQFPLQKQINSQRVIERIDPKKDIDGFHPYNLGRLAQRNPTLRSCTPFGIVYLLEQLPIELSGKEAVIIGRSTIVGLPMALELIMKDCTVTICHSKTQNIIEKVRGADIVVAAIGRPEWVKGDWIKEGAVVIDVGINRLDDGRLVGDVDFKAAKEKAGWITPVPGGVGPMTIAMLLKNTLMACEAIN